MQGGRGGRTCKFGDNCNKFAQGTCTFIHQNAGGNNNGGGGRGGGRGGYSNPQDSYNPKGGSNPGYSYPPDNGYKGTGGGRGGGRGTNGGFGNEPYDYGKNNYNQGGNQPQQYPANKQPYSNPNQPSNTNYNQNKPNNNSPNDDFSNKFCRNFHFDIPCKFQNKCNRKHGFDLQEHTKVRRVKFMRDVPSHNDSKLGKFIKDGQCYLVLRMGSSVTIMSYNYETEGFDFVGEWKFPNPDINYTFYDQNENFIYISAENPKTMLHDIVVYNMLSSEMIIIENAHESAVTGIVHVSPNVMLTCSKDGYIKVWKVTGTSAVLDKESSDGLHKSYSQGQKVELMFLNFKNIKGTNIISVGTNDNRVLFFIGDQMNFNQLVLGEKQANVYMIKYYVSEAAIVGFVVTWSSDRMYSSVVAIDLNDFKNNQVVSVDSKENKRNNIYMIQVANDKLFVSYLNGTVNFYSLPAMEKVGAMLHGNFVNSIVQNQHVTSTNIKINQLFLLESRFNDKQGSIGVYIMKQ